MIHTNRTTYNGFLARSSRSGSAYVLALVTLLTGTILALTMLRSGSASFIAEDSRTKKMAAAGLAEAGIDYAYWQVHYKGANLPYSANINLAHGSFSVQATDDGSHDPSTMLITSTGTSGKHSHTIKRVMLGLLPYRYSWCENMEINTDKRVSVIGSGGLRANGRITLSNNNNNITTGAWATGNINNSGTVTPKYPGSPPIRFPDIDFSYYDSIATWKAYSNIVILNLWGGGILLVNGNININGLYTGVYTIIATGNIVVSAPLLASGPGSYLALITDETIDIQPLALTVDAIMYARKGGAGRFVPGNGSGEIKIHGATTINGCMFADRITNDNTVTINRPSNLNLSLMRQLRLPGL